jgi:hypothetical protein
MVLRALITQIPVFLHTLRACAARTAIHAFFKQHPFCLTYFLATAQESKHKMVGNHFEHLKDGP